MNIIFPKEILKYVENLKYTENRVGMTESVVLTFDEYVLKIEKTYEESNNEIRMLNWLQNRLPVPKVISFTQKDGYNYILMSKVKGLMLFDDEILKDPFNAAKLLADGIKMLWNIDITECPYNNSLDNKLRLAKYRVQNNLVDELDIDFEYLMKFNIQSTNELLEYLIKNKPKEDKVLSHGDYCLPNILIKENEISGFIDLGRAGISDMWQDIALGVRSFIYNLKDEYKEVYIDEFFNQLGIKKDNFKIKYYILLDELF